MSEQQCAVGQVDRFFTEAPVPGPRAHQRWQAGGELDPVTVSRLLLWAADRAVHARRPPLGDPAEVRERALLLGWLAARGYRSLP